MNQNEQHERVSKALDDFRIEIGFKITLCETFNGGLRTYRHKDGSFDRAMGGMKQSGAGTCRGAFCLDLETESGHSSSLSDA